MPVLPEYDQKGDSPGAPGATAESEATAVERLTHRVSRLFRSNVMRIGPSCFSYEVGEHAAAIERRPC